MKSKKQAEERPKPSAQSQEILRSWPRTERFLKGFKPAGKTGKDLKKARRAEKS